MLPQAPDQEQISEESLEGLREEFDLKNEEKKLIENQAIEKKQIKKDRKASRKEKKE